MPYLPPGYEVRDGALLFVTEDAKGERFEQVVAKVHDWRLLDAFVQAMIKAGI